MTFLELCNAVRQECGIQGQGPVTVTSQNGILKRIIEWTCAADLLIQGMYPDWDFLWKEFSDITIEGYSTITKPNDLGVWDRESFAINRGTEDGYPLSIIDYREWRKNNSAKANSQPSSLAITPSNDLELTSPADGEYTISAEYWRQPTKLTTNTQEPVYPERFQRAIIARAKMWFFEDVESIQQWQLSDNEFKIWIGRLEAYALPYKQELGQMSPTQMVVRPI